MRLFRLHIVTLFLICALYSNAQSGNTTLKKEITFQADSILKSSFLDTLRTRYGIHFSYNPELLNAQQKVSVNLVEQPLFSVLKELIDSKVLDFKALNNQIIFYPIQPNESAELIVPYKLIKGTVFDKRKGKAIPYCNIGVANKALGTMTNMNGQFVLKITEEYWSDTLSFSCLGYESYLSAISTYPSKEQVITLAKKIYKIRTIDVIKYDPEYVLEMLSINRNNNYEKEYALFTTFYRELIQENDEYTDISEAVLQVLKAPYSNTFREDHVKFLKGRKGSVSKPFSDIRFRLRGGPNFITKLDVVKNNESFINPEFRHLYSYNFDRVILIDNREVAVIEFTPIYGLRDILYEGKLYVDVETWALARVDFEYTKQGLKEARYSLIQKEPRHCKAIPTELCYTIQYKLIQNKWYLYSARSTMNIKLNNKEEKLKTKFKSVSEMLITNIEKGDFQHFTKQEIFRSNEIFTDKIVSYDKLFWKNYNVILPEERLVNALRNFDSQNLIITNL